MSQYLDPYHKHIITSSTPNSSGEYLVSNASTTSLPRSQNNFILSSNENNSYTSLINQQSPLQHTHHHHHHVQQQDSSLVADSSNVLHNHIATKKEENEKSSRSRRHYHVSQSCNPCMGHLISKRDKSVDKDNASLDAYDLASPCCEANCVPVKRRSRHHKEHHHKYKHKERPPRPKSQSNVTTQIPSSSHIHTYESAKHVSFILSYKC